MGFEAVRKQLRRNLRFARRRLQAARAYRRSRVIRWSPYENVYHCCTQKTASQWFRRIFSDPGVYPYTGLAPYPYVQLGLRYAHFDGPLPMRTMGIHLYVDYRTYAAIPKPASYGAFFILRDPRDIVTSWYFSAKYSHRRVGPIPAMRQEMEQMDFHEGMRYIIHKWDEFGLFQAQRSWMSAAENQHLENPHPERPQAFKIFRYEDFAQDNYGFLKQLFDYLQIEMPDPEFDALYDRHRFELVARGRQQGMENLQSHYRKGISGDWVHYFDDSLLDYFETVTGDLLEVLGYQE